MTSCQNTTIKQSINRFALPLVGLSLAKISCKFSREKILQIPHYDNLLINTRTDITVDSVKAKEEPAPLSPLKEFVGYATFILVMFALFFSEKLGLSNWQIAVAGACIIGLFGVLDKKELVSSMSMGTLMLYVGCLAIANALAATGAAKLIGDACGKLIIASKSNIVANLIFFIVPFIMTQFLLNGGVGQIFYALWAMTCAQLGCNPIGAMILCLAAVQTAIFTPLATPAVPLAMQFGGYEIKDLLKMGWLPAVITTLISVISVAIVFPIF